MHSLASKTEFDGTCNPTYGLLYMLSFVILHVAFLSNLLNWRHPMFAASSRCNI